MAFSSQVPEDSIRVSFYDIDGIRVDNVTKEQAQIIAQANPGKLFYFQDKDGLQRELNIEEVLNLTPERDLISDTVFGSLICPTEPQPCGPPKVQFFGGGGVGAMANAVISPISSGVMAFDIVESGKNYLTDPFVVLQDECGTGSGSSLVVITEPSGKVDEATGKQLLQVKNVYVQAPGDEFLSNFDGSLGGNGRVWKKADEGFVKTKDGKYYTVPTSDPPPNLDPLDTWNPPTPSVLSPDIPTPPSYKVVIILEDVVIEDPGFGYNPEDTITVTPDNGAVLLPKINPRGEVIGVDIVSKGIGFLDLPEIVVESETGYNAVIRPILGVTRILNENELLQIPEGVSLISVVDCVGKIAPKDKFDKVPR